jgi:acetylornithine deacetylase/succinyl-diaminopimelate desuccinylase-like protein
MLAEHGGAENRQRAFGRRGHERGKKWSEWTSGPHAHRSPGNSPPLTDDTSCDVPLVPTMSTGATDGIFLEAIGIPVYGVPGEWGDPDGDGVHGLNERSSVRSVFIGRDFLTDLIKAYADSD